MYVYLHDSPDAPCKFSLPCSFWGGELLLFWELDCGMLDDFVDLIEPPEELHSPMDSLCICRLSLSFPPDLSSRSNFELTSDWLEKRNDSISHRQASKQESK